MGQGSVHEAAPQSVLQVVQESLAPMLASAARENDTLRQQLTALSTQKQDLADQLVDAQRKVLQLELQAQRHTAAPLTSQSRVHELEQALHKCTLAQGSLLRENETLKAQSLETQQTFEQLTARALGAEASRMRLQGEHTSLASRQGDKFEQTHVLVIQENSALKQRLESLNWLAQQEADRACAAQGRASQLEDEVEILKNDVLVMQQSSEECRVKYQKLEVQWEGGAAAVQKTLVSTQHERDVAYSGLMRSREDTLKLRQEKTALETEKHALQTVSIARLKQFEVCIHM